MAKKSRKKRRSRGPAPKGKPGAATRAQTKERAKPRPKERGERRDLFALARATTHTQRLVAATIVVGAVAIGGFFAGRSQGSPTFREDREQAVVDAVAADNGEVDAPITFQIGTGDEAREICVQPAQDYAVTDGACTG